MSTLKTIMVGLTLVLISQCSSEEIKLPELDKIDISLDMLDSNNESKRVFKYGEKMIFALNVKNQNDDAISYTYTDVVCDNPILGFTVTDSNGVTVGDFLPDSGELNCTLELVVIELTSSQILNYKKSWLEPVLENNGDTTYNKTLDVGTYNFNCSFSMKNWGDGDEENRDVDLEMSFEVVE